MYFLRCMQCSAAMSDAPLDGLDVAPSELEFLEKIGSGCTAEV